MSYFIAHYLNASSLFLVRFNIQQMLACIASHESDCATFRYFFALDICLLKELNCRLVEVFLQLLI
jgi:hypothetical protein